MLCDRQRHATLASRSLWFVRAMTRQKLDAKLFRARNGWDMALAWSTRNADGAERRDAIKPVSTDGADVSRIRWPAA